MDSQLDQPYLTQIDTTLVSIKNRLRKLNHKNPYTNKRITRRNERTISQAQAIEKNVNERLAEESDQEKTSQYYRILKELAEYIQPDQTIDEQLQDLHQNKQSLGIMKFDWDVDCQDTFMNQFTLIIAPSKSGKSFLINQLTYEIPHSFDKICFFMGKASYQNKCPQVLKHVAGLAGIKTQWINTDSEVKPEFSDNPDLCFESLNDDGSSNFIYNNTTYPSIYIFDDLYTKPTDHWVVNFMDTMGCMSRHRKTSCFIAFQGFTKLSNKLVDNATKIFLFYDIIGREDLWRKLKIPPPANLQQVLTDIQYGMHTRWYYLDDDRLVEYVPYDIVSKQQAINKMKSKLPKAITDEKKRKEIEEKNKQLKELEAELGINKEGTPAKKEGKRSSPYGLHGSSEGRSYRVVDVKDAVEVKPKEYTQEINTKEFNFIQAPRHTGARDSYAPSDGTANYTTPQSKKGLRSKYNLL